MSNKENLLPDPNKNPDEYIWKETQECRDRTHWKLTHKTSHKIIFHTTYGDGWGFTDEEMMGMDSHKFAVYLARTW